MEHKETFVKRWKRWWAWKKESVSKWWTQQKMALSKFYKPYRVYWPLYEGTKSPPIVFHWDNRPNPPKITLSALTEADQAESTIPVLNQRSHCGIEVIPSALADTRCADLGIDGVLERLNATLGTSYTLGSRILRLLRIRTLQSILKPYVERNDDFGTVYAHLRHFWYHYDVAAIQRVLRPPEDEDRKMRREVLVHDRITKRDVPPRRVWDLYANRVVLYWVAQRSPCGISHAWVDEKDRVDVMTPINGYEWPVPMPKDANLDLIRIEMLNARYKRMPYARMEYAWLDVLCLRQEGGKNEHLRVDEWKLDVPTIGFVYASTRPVVCYFNGLGRPLHLTAHDFESDRCWFRRAWTLQEITEDPIIGGQTEDDVMEQEVRRKFDEQLTSLRQIRERTRVLEYALEMQNRISTKPLDKVAGLVHPLWTHPIPIYDAQQSEVDAWEVLMDVIDSQFRGQLFFFYPQPGNGRKRWRPSWEQVMTNKFIALHSSVYTPEVYTMEDPDTDCYGGCRIELGDVQGLAEVPKEGKPRQGELVFNDAARSPHKFKIVADHAYPIPDGTYTLLGSKNYVSHHNWVVGQLREEEKFEKFSIFRLVDDKQVKLQDLGFRNVTTFLC